MSSYAKILSLAYNSAVATKTSALKSHYRSLRLIKEPGAINPGADSTVTNVLLNGKCIDPETRNLYVFYIDTFYGSSWIIEINLDTRVQTVVYYDKENNIGFDPKYKIYNPKVVNGRIIWTDNKNPIYQMDIARAKKSYELRIGYGQYPNTVEWDSATAFGIEQIVSNGKRYYKSLVDNNTGIEPRSDDGSNWQDLKCLIEDAYYSMNVENFYFAPIPPKFPPTIEYVSVDSRKINNLKQTLFQVAYRYIYMDWRKSTFSPASIVALPQAEEDVSTGLVNEQISLNNALRIKVNLGGEEVRAVEIIARSSDDPSKWFLIDTIEKFEEQERNDEVSRTAELDYSDCAITIPASTVVNLSNASASRNNSILSPLPPSALNSYISSSESGMNFADTDSGFASAVAAAITCPPGYAKIVSRPSWLIIADSGALSLPDGTYFTSGSSLYCYPLEANTGALRSGNVVLGNDYGDSCIILVSQNAYVAPPPVPITPSVQVDPLDVSGMTIVVASASGMTLSNLITFSLTPNHPGYSEGEEFTIYWRALVNGVNYGNHSFEVLDQLANSISISLTDVLAVGDSVVIYLSADSYLDSTPSTTNASIGVMQPLPPTQSSIDASSSNMTFTETGGSGEAQTSVITCPPGTCVISTIPAWLTVQGTGGYNLYAGAIIPSGITLSIFPTEDNAGSERSGYVEFTNDYGDTASIYVYQAAASTPPLGAPVSSDYEVSSGDTSGMSVLFSGFVYSGDAILYASITPEHPTLSSWTMYWKAYINGVFMGSGSYDASNTSEDRTFILNDDAYVGDEINIVFSSVYF